MFQVGLVVEFSPQRARHRQVARQHVVQRGNIGRALNVGMTAQGHDAPAGTAYVAEQHLQDAPGANDLDAEGVLRPAHRVGQVGRPLPARVLDQRVGNLEEEMLRDPADLLNHLRRITGVVPLHDLQDAARVLHRFIALDLAGVRVREQALALLYFGHDVMIVVIGALPFLRGGGCDRWFVGWFARFPFFRHFVLPARGIVRTPIFMQA